MSKKREQQEVEHSTLLFNSLPLGTFVCPASLLKHSSTRRVSTEHGRLQPQQFRVGFETESAEGHQGFASEALSPIFLADPVAELPGTVQHIVAADDAYVADVGSVFYSANGKVVARVFGAHCETDLGMLKQIRRWEGVPHVSCYLEVVCKSCHVRGVSECGRPDKEPLRDYHGTTGGAIAGRDSLCCG
ncbi:hypothetical protein CH063_08656 [Colletotrichum higginsianum]|uniref:Uncharacterized protein n=1 Tax=Colletotrichum higginsianum (strain IMI 349063) TaxID=759273 RepID=H1VAM9_COLHI|nr:hypothetical protein CH063_08656 [Colletotrichum higginsianum]